MKALLIGVLLAVALLFWTPSSFTRIQTVHGEPANELIGLWEAKRRFGPDVRGTLIIRQIGDEYSAEIAGAIVKARLNGDSISFKLPNGKGEFRGDFEPRVRNIAGYWIQEKSIENGLPYASPVTLTKYGNGEWRGEVSPVDNGHTFYLMVQSREDGSLAAFLRNPERNLGWTKMRVDHIEREGDDVKLVTQTKGTEKGKVIAEGCYYSDDGQLSLFMPYGNATYDFKKVADGQLSDFYPRGRPGVPYRYTRPPTLDDGWETATLEDVGISRPAIEKFIQTIIDTPIDSVRSQEDHGILIARHGKLVLEEYFHGENREKPHDTRSASKSVATELMGAAMQAGNRLSVDDFVYKVMNDGQFPPDLEPRKRALKVEHLLTMSSGFDCDDNGANSAGFEDHMWSQTSYQDFYKWTMALNMVRDPGTEAVYCSANANLVGGVIARLTKRSLPNLFRKLLAEPLQINRYYLPMSPQGDYTLTGSARFLPRDFMKLGQLHLNNGTWKGRRIYTSEWSNRATSPLTKVPAYKLNYGYLWWTAEYPYKGQNIRSYFASGNGGQMVLVIPDLDMVLAFYAGNYSDAGGRSRNVYVPQYILPAIEK